MSEPATEFVELFANLYLHLYPRSEATEYRLSRESAAVLGHLSISGPVRVTEAARHFGRSQAAMSEMFERLISRGFLARQPDPRDRRSHLIWLTELGREAVRRENEPLEREAVARVFSELAPETIEPLLLGLRELLSAAERVAQQTRRKPDDDNT